MNKIRNNNMAIKLICKSKLKMRSEYFQEWNERAKGSNSGGRLSPKGSKVTLSVEGNGEGEVLRVFLEESEQERIFSRFEYGSRFCEGRGTISLELLGPRPLDWRTCIAEEAPPPYHHCNAIFRRLL